jgi:dienelactone hydrolase
MNRIISLASSSLLFYHRHRLLFHHQSPLPLPLSLSSLVFSFPVTGPMTHRLRSSHAKPEQQHDQHESDVPSPSSSSSPSSKSKPHHKPPQSHHDDDEQPAPHGRHDESPRHEHNTRLSQIKKQGSSTKATKTMATTTTSGAKGEPVTCPPGTPGSVPSGPYVPKGEDVKLGDLPAYVVGRGEIGIIVAQEIFGINQGRLKQNCDMLADAGFVAVIADYHRGVNFDTLGKDWSRIPEFANRATWPKIQADVDTHLIPLLKSRGATKFGAWGFCWGSWLVLHLAATGKLAAGAYCHPSHTKLAHYYHEVSNDLVTASKCPILCYAAGDDGDDVKPGGNDEKLLASKPFADKNEFKAWPDVKHGFVSRLPLEGSTGRDYPLAVKGVIEFFKRTIV